MFNVHLSYKPPSYGRILFRLERRPGKFSCIKKFRDLVVSGRFFCKGKIIQGRQLKRRISCGRPVMPEKKRGCNGSICSCTHTEEYYVSTYSKTVYIRYQTTKTLSLSNPPIQTTPPRNPSLDPLQTRNKDTSVQ